MKGPFKLTRWGKLGVGAYWLLLVALWLTSAVLMSKAGCVAIDQACDVTP